MKSIDEAEAQARLDEILDEAQQQPIAIQRQGQDVAVMVSMTVIHLSPSFEPRSPGDRHPDDRKY